MKTLFFFLIISSFSIAQVFDEPIDSTEHYAFRLYAQSARVPAEILNEDKEKIDSLIYALIVWTDTLQLIMVSDLELHPTQLALKISNYATGIDSFVTTATADTFTVQVDTLEAGVDYFFIQAYGDAISANDQFAFSIISPNKVRVVRPASGTSGLKYIWRWIRRY